MPSTPVRIRAAQVVGAACLALALAPAVSLAQQPGTGGEGPATVAVPRGPVVARGTFGFGQVAPSTLPVLRFLRAGASLTSGPTSSGSTWRVPAGRRLVIEQVSVRVETEDQGELTPRFLLATLTADVASGSGNATRWEHFVSAAVAGVFSGRARYSSTETVRYYAFEGERLSLRAQLDAPTPNGATATYTVTGYLE